MHVGLRQTIHERNSSVVVFFFKLSAGVLVQAAGREKKITLLTPLLVGYVIKTADMYEFQAV